VKLLANVVATVIGGEEWDRMILVEYPSKEAFLSMSGGGTTPVMCVRMHCWILV
tara:strand:+ start:800 stop:961 length:162 start_codon:yes stop_codon:yes gene_type:complete